MCIPTFECHGTLALPFAPPLNTLRQAPMIAAALKEADTSKVQSILLKNHFKCPHLPEASTSISLHSIPSLGFLFCIDPVIERKLSFWNASLAAEVAPLCFVFDSSPLSLFSNAGTPYKELVTGTLNTANKVTTQLECKSFELGDFVVWVAVEEGKHLVLVVVRHCLGNALLERALVQRLFGEEEAMQVGEFGLKFLKAERFI
jgi:hypothetical protein